MPIIDQDDPEISFSRLCMHEMLLACRLLFSGETEDAFDILYHTKLTNRNTCQSQKQKGMTEYLSILNSLRNAWEHILFQPNNQAYSNQIDMHLLFFFCNLAQDKKIKEKTIDFLCSNSQNILIFHSL